MRFWGYVNVTAEYDIIDIYTDSYEEIFAALSLLKTGEGTTTIPAFSDGTSLHDIIKKYAKAE